MNSTHAIRLFAVFSGFMTIAGGGLAENPRRCMVAGIEGRALVRRVGGDGSAVLAAGMHLAAADVVMVRVAPVKATMFDFLGGGLVVVELPANSKMTVERILRQRGVSTLRRMAEGLRDALFGSGGLTHELGGAFDGQSHDPAPASPLRARFEVASSPGRTLKAAVDRKMAVRASSSAGPSSACDEEKHDPVEYFREERRFDGSDASKIDGDLDSKDSFDDDDEALGGSSHDGLGPSPVVVVLENGRAVPRSQVRFRLPAGVESPARLQVFEGANLVAELPLQSDDSGVWTVVDLSQSSIEVGAALTCRVLDGRGTQIGDTHWVRVLAPSLYDDVLKQRRDLDAETEPTVVRALLFLTGEGYRAAGAPADALELFERLLAQPELPAGDRVVVQERMADLRAAVGTMVDE